MPVCLPMHSSRSAAPPGLGPLKTTPLKVLGLLGTSRPWAAAGSTPAFRLGFEVVARSGTRPPPVTSWSLLLKFWHPSIMLLSVPLPHHWGVRSPSWCILSPCRHIRASHHSPITCFAPVSPTPDTFQHSLSSVSTFILAFFSLHLGEWLCPSADRGYPSDRPGALSAAQTLTWGTQCSCAPVSVNHTDRLPVAAPLLRGGT